MNGIFIQILIATACILIAYIPSTFVCLCGLMFTGAWKFSAIAIIICLTGIKLIKKPFILVITLVFLLVYGHYMVKETWEDPHKFVLTNSSILSQPKH